MKNYEMLRLLCPNDEIISYLSAIYSMMKYKIKDVEFINDCYKNKKIRNKKLIELKNTISWIFKEHEHCLYKLASFYGKHDTNTFINLLISIFTLINACNSNPLITDIFKANSCITYGMNKTIVIKVANSMK